MQKKNPKTHKGLSWTATEAEQQLLDQLKLLATPTVGSCSRETREKRQVPLQRLLALVSLPFLGIQTEKKWLSGGGRGVVGIAAAYRYSTCCAYNRGAAKLEPAV